MSTSAERMRRLRSRRAAERAALREVAGVDPDQLLLPAVETTIAALALRPEDAGTAALALAVAKAVDERAHQAYALRDLSPLLLRLLDSLGATPVSRARIGR